MKFLCDMCVSMRVVEWLRQNGHDAVHLRDEGLQRLSNGEIFEKADREGRVVITFDLGFGEIVASTGTHLPSVVVLRLRNAHPDNVIRRIERVLDESAAALRAGAIISVEETRHRVRVLPAGK